MRRAVIRMLCLVLSTESGLAQENTLSSMWDRLEPSEASLGARDGTIVDTSSGKDPKAPATATVMHAGGPCLAEVSGAVQWPGAWAALTTSAYDFRKVSGYGFYAETGMPDLSKPGLGPNDPRVQTIVLIGQGFACHQGVHLKHGAQTYQYSCDDSLVVGVFSSFDWQKALRALGAQQAACAMPALGK